MVYTYATELKNKFIKISTWMGSSMLFFSSHTCSAGVAAPVGTERENGTKAAKPAAPEKAEHNEMG